MEISVIKIGNSKGIRLPKTVLRQFSIEDKLEMEVHESEIVLKPVRTHPREGWKEAFEKMHEEKEDFEWEWE